MTLLTLPRASIPVIDSKGHMSREWYRWATDATTRMGGVDGSGTDDLTLSQFEDAGIEELKLSAYRLSDQVAAMESALSEVRDQMTAVLRKIQDLNEGPSL